MLKILKSKYLRDICWWSSGSSGKIILARSTNFVPIGSNNNVVATLNIVCTLAIWAATLFGVILSTKWAKGNNILILTNITVPIILKVKWIIVVLLAFLLVPIEAKTEVIQVPIFWPNKT